MKFPRNRTLWIGVVAVFAATMLSGCVLAPPGAKDEKDRLARAGRQYERTEPIPELPLQPTWWDVLHRAFLANGELEAAYFEWAMAVSRIQQAGAYPNSPLSVGFEYMFSDENMKSWDRTTISVGPDAMESLAFPTKVMQSAKVATKDAQVAGERFAAAKFGLQRRVLNAWIDYTLEAERVRIQRENISLLRLLNETAVGRVQAGGSQQDMLRTDIELRRAENELLSMEAQLPQMRAMLNAMLGRAADAPLPPPSGLPPVRVIPADDATLLAAGVSANPELKALARETAGRRDALERARMEYIPDFNPFAAITGDIEQVLGVGITLPTVIPRIQGMVKEARADLRRVQAMARQTRLDRNAEYVASLYALRNAERQARVYEEFIIPSARRVHESARQSYSAGTGMYLDLIEAQRTLLGVQLALAEAKAAREKSLADLEALAGVDVETLAPRGPTTTTTTPSTRPFTTGQEHNHDHE
jgi:outer membrane protein, heavy metal efflux system